MSSTRTKKPKEWETKNERVVKYNKEQTVHLRKRLAGPPDNPYPSPEQLMRARIVSAQILMPGYRGDRERMCGMLANAANLLQNKDLARIYESVFKAIVKLAKSWEVKNEDQAARKPRARRANPTQRKDARGYRAAGRSEGKAPARKGTRSRTRKPAG